MPAWTHDGIAALHADAPPLGDLLPWRWVEADAIHALADGSLGLAWRLPLLDAELLTPEQREPLARAFDGLLARLPAGVAVQVILVSEPGRSRRLDEWATARDGHAPLLHAMAGARLAALTTSTPASVPVRELAVLLTLRYWPPAVRRRGGWRRLARWARGASADDDAARAWRDTEATLATCRVLVESQCRVAGLAPQRLDGAGLLAAVWPVLNPGGTEPPPRYRDDWALHTQATQTDHAFRPDGWTTSGLSPRLEGRILSLLTLPAETWPGLVTLPRAVGGPGGLLDLPGTLWFTVAGHVLDQERAVAWLKLKRTLAFQQRLTLLGDTAVETMRIKGEIDQLLDRAFAGGKRMCQAAAFLACLAPPDRIGERVEQARACFGQAEMRLYPERLITLPCWLQSLPLGYDPALEHYTQRGRRLLSENLADLLPLYGGFAGTRSATQLLLSRRGELVTFDPWDSETAPHMLVTGKTGAGKSFLVADLILQQRRQGAAVFVLDKGDSYRRLAELLDGQYCRLSAERPITLNPFAGAGDAEHQAFLLRLLGEMAAGGETRSALTREEYGLLSEALAGLFAARELGAEPTLSTLAVSLTEPPFSEDGTGRRLRRRLFPFLAPGPYGRFFDGPNAFRPDAALTVVELGDLAAKPDLRAAMVLVLMHAIRTFAGGLPIGQRKLVVIDEAWSLLASEDSAAALAEAARTYRKLNAAAVFISQRLEDFEGPHGKAVRDNCAVRWLLEQAPEAIGSVRALLDLNSAETAALRSVASRKGQYSEALLVTGSGSGIVRLAVDPITYWTVTSDPADLARWQAARAETAGDPRAALERILGRPLAEGHGHSHRATGLTREEVSR
jgi:type-IV secretion system protein TraC